MRAAALSEPVRYVRSSEKMRFLGRRTTERTLFVFIETDAAGRRFHDKGTKHVTLLTFEPPDSYNFQLLQRVHTNALDELNAELTADVKRMEAELDEIKRELSALTCNS